MAESDRGRGTVLAVEPGAAAAAGLRPGDRVLLVDGEQVRDIIDWWWLTDEPAFVLVVERAGERVDLTVERTPGEPLGVVFDGVVFDGIRECDNACAFCFVRQLPHGLRDALYVRDDDFRLSFLSGNFITLTNLSSADVKRIIAQRLSPLHVSVHAVDPDVRASLICPTGQDRALEIIDVLCDAGIELHVQVVLVPGVNDGAILERTLDWLGMRARVASVGVVPIGYTAHQTRWKASFTPEAAALVLEQLAARQSRMRAERGVGWVYAADEFYLRAGSGVPPADAYDDFPQFENGIGMVRTFIEEFRPPTGLQTAAVLVTGEMFAPVLRAELAHHDVSGTEVLAVPNRLFGGNVSVTGLLSGDDIVRAVSAAGGDGPYLVPDVVVNSDGLLLDDLPADRLPERTGRDVRVIGSDGASLQAALTDLGRRARP